MRFKVGQEVVTELGYRKIAATPTSEGVSEFFKNVVKNGLINGYDIYDVKLNDFTLGTGGAYMDETESHMFFNSNEIKAVTVARIDGDGNIEVTDGINTVNKVYHDSKDIGGAIADAIDELNTQYFLCIRYCATPKFIAGKVYAVRGTKTQAEDNTTCDIYDIPDFFSNFFPVSDYSAIKLP